MLRFLYTITGLFSSLFAILSPVAIFHWLIRAMNMGGLGSSVAFLNPVFDPLNALLEFFMKPPPLVFEGTPVSTTQGVLACVLTMLFFVCNVLSEWLKATEQRLDVDRQAAAQRKRLHKLQSEQKKKEKQIITNRRILAQVCYEFEQCPTGGARFETTYQNYRGNMMEALPDTITLQFETLESALKYALDASQSVLSHYAQLRPADPQPPFRVAIQAVDNTLSAPEGMVQVRNLTNFAGPNQVIFSQDVRTMIDAQSLNLIYHYQSLGMYAVEGKQQELFRLYAQKRDQSF